MQKIFIDGGANVGTSIKLFLNKYPNAEDFKIYSFEANSKLIKSLEKYKDKATIFNKAIYTEDTTINFYTGDSLSSSLRKDKTTGRLNISSPVQVEAIDLASFIKSSFSKKDYIVLKLDVEGAEYSILPHLIQESIFDGWVNELFGEWHYTKLKYVTKEQHDALEKALSAKGFSMKEWCAERNIIQL